MLQCKSPNSSFLRQMNRDEFLSHWTPFPAAPADCESLNRWRKTAGWVGGRFVYAPAALENGRFFLSSEQAEPLSLVWEGGLPLPPFQAGDHIAVLVDKPKSDNSWVARKAVLLVPAHEVGNTAMNADYARFVQQVRAFFMERGFREIETPSLVVCPGLEPALEPFAAELQMGSTRRKLFLPTSPEIHLKKALCLGFTDIFEIKTCYRNGEISELHQPEFHMLEWYRAYAGLDLVIGDLKALLTTLQAPPLKITTFQQLFQKHLNARLTPETCRAELLQWCSQYGLHTDRSDTAADLFHRLWLEKIEQELKNPTVVRDFPPEQAALARLKTDGWADRFEFFWQGIEIANAFHEVNDPKEQVERWAGESRERDRLGRTVLSGDDDLLGKMRTHGLPPTGGIALGVERLFMASRGITDIRALRLFPYR